MTDETAGAAFMWLEPNLVGHGAEPYSGWERAIVKVPKRSPGWDGVIEAVDRKLQPVPHRKKTPATRKRHRYIAEAVLLLRAVKEARNTTMHDYAKTYTIAQAEDQYRAVRNFMTKMADEA